MFGHSKTAAWKVRYLFQAVCNLHSAWCRKCRRAYAHARLIISHLTRQCECCKGDLQSQWEKANFDSQPTQNPWTDRHQIWMAWLRRRPLTPKNRFNSLRGFCSPYRWNILPSCSKFTTLFWFLNSPRGESVRPIFTLNMSNDAVRREDVPF